MAEAGTYDLKSRFFNAATVRGLAARLVAADDGFDDDGFIADACDGLDELELKARSAQIMAAMAPRLPGDFNAAVTVLLAALGTPPADTGEDSDGFRLAPILDYVAAHGLEAPDLALDALAAMTLHFSAEFAIRPFIHRYPDKTMKQMLAWTGADDRRLRRLASEGCRPRLPWGQRLHGLVADPAPVIAILDRMHDDAHDSVRRSVANNLNDIAKDHPDLAVEVAARWWATGAGGSRWTAKHGLRSLVKQGHGGALAVLGFTGGDGVAVEALDIAPRPLAIGGEGQFDFAVVSREPTDVRLAVDYVLDRPLAGGKRGRKVFKVATVDLRPGEKARFARRIGFKQLSTRTYYPGRYGLEVVVNGRVAGTLEFDVGG